MVKNSKRERETLFTHDKRELNSMIHKLFKVKSAVINENRYRLKKLKQMQESEPTSSHETSSNFRFSSSSADMCEPSANSTLPESANECSNSSLGNGSTMSKQRHDSESTSSHKSSHLRFSSASPDQFDPSANSTLPESANVEYPTSTLGNSSKMSNQRFSSPSPDQFEPSANSTLPVSDNVECSTSPMEISKSGSSSFPESSTLVPVKTKSQDDDSVSKETRNHETPSSTSEYPDSSVPDTQNKTEGFTSHFNINGTVNTQVGSIDSSSDDDVTIIEMSPRPVPMPRPFILQVNKSSFPKYFRIQILNLDPEIKYNEVKTVVVDLGIEPKRIADLLLINDPEGSVATVSFDKEHSMITALSYNGRITNRGRTLTIRNYDPSWIESLRGEPLKKFAE